MLAKGIRQPNGLEVATWNSLNKPDTELTLPAGLLLVKVPVNPRVHPQSPQGTGGHAQHKPSHPWVDAPAFGGSDPGLFSKVILILSLTIQKRPSFFLPLCPSSTSLQTNWLCVSLHQQIACLFLHWNYAGSSLHWSYGKMPERLQNRRW